ncbi:MAG: mechanosensitive ion channel family protein [Dehalococcoidia bacterium]|nr:mechanosensitive ion channel family protein [Dehalococcoidia bacterium]MSQ34618.1 mechanosensitive ion channel family protein [Dehalococcoidia bacterium]
MGNPTDGSFMAWFADHGLYAVLVVLGWAVIWYIAHRVTEAWISRSLKRLEDNWLLGDFVREDSVLRWLDEIIVAVVLGVPAIFGVLDVLGVDMGPTFKAVRGWLGDSLVPWLTDHGVKLALIMLVGWLAKQIVARAVVRLLTKVIVKATQEEEEPQEAKKRADTLSGVIGGIVSVVIYLVVLLTALQDLSVPVGPLIGSLGLAGVAVGFGSQWLVRDVIAGAFIIGENQYRRGDVVEVSGVSGVVESINLRRTMLRDIDGKVHIVPNGEIKVASNFSRKWARVNLDIQVAYKHDMDHVLRVITEICQRMSREPYWSEIILEAPKPLGITAFEASGVTIKVLGMTRPMKNFEVKLELLYRIKKRFDEEGIEIPFQHMTVYWGEGAHPARGGKGSTEEAKAAQASLQEKARAAAERKAMAAEESMVHAIDAAENSLSHAFDRLAARRAEIETETRAGYAGGSPDLAGDARKVAVKPAGEAHKSTGKLSDEARKTADKLKGSDDSE